MPALLFWPEYVNNRNRKHRFALMRVVVWKRIAQLNKGDGTLRRNKSINAVEFEL